MDGWMDNISSLIVIALFKIELLVKQQTREYPRSKNVTQTQYRPNSPTITLCTWHASKYKVHELHQRYILT